MGWRVATVQFARSLVHVTVKSLARVPFMPARNGGGPHTRGLLGRRTPRSAAGTVRGDVVGVAIGGGDRPIFYQIFTLSPNQICGTERSEMQQSVRPRPNNTDYVLIGRYASNIFITSVYPTIPDM